MCCGKREPWANQGSVEFADASFPGHALVVSLDWSGVNRNCVACVLECEIRF